MGDSLQATSRAWLSAVGFVLPGYVCEKADQNVSKSVTESSGLWLICSDWRKAAVRYSKYVLGAYHSDDCVCPGAACYLVFLLCYTQPPFCSCFVLARTHTLTVVWIFGDSALGYRMMAVYDASPIPRWSQRTER